MHRFYRAFGGNPPLGSRGLAHRLVLGIGLSWFEQAEPALRGNQGAAMSKNSEYVSHMEMQMKQWDADVDALVAEGARVSAEKRAMYESQVKGLRANRDSAKLAFQRLGVAGESLSGQMRDGMDAAWDTMQDALAKATLDLRR